MLATYLVGGHVRAQLTRLVVRAVVELFFSSRVWTTGVIVYVYYFTICRAIQLVHASNIASAFKL